MDGFQLTGVLGWWFWGIAHIWYLIGFRSRVVVAFNWFWSHLTRQRGARLILDATAQAEAMPAAANDPLPQRQRAAG
jgi:NADH dehydrogenase